MMDSAKYYRRKINKEYGGQRLSLNEKVTLE